MAEHDDPQDATPVAPAPHEVSPSSTGLVDGDPTEVEEAPVDPNERS